MVEVRDDQNEFEVSSCEVVFPRAAQYLVVFRAQVMNEVGRLVEVAEDPDYVSRCEVMSCEISDEFLWYGCRVSFCLD